MPKAIDRERVRQLIGEGAQLVEVLPRAEYEDGLRVQSLTVPVNPVMPSTDPAQP